MKVRRCDVCGAEVGKEDVYRFRLWAIPIRVEDESVTLHPQDICETCMLSISRTLVRLRKEREENALEVYNPYRPRHEEKSQSSDTAEERTDDGGSEQTVPKVRKRKPKASTKDGKADKRTDNTSVPVLDGEGLQG